MSGRQASYYDPESEEFVLIDTCYGTHHLQFAEDAKTHCGLVGQNQIWGVIPNLR
ncbi:MAG: hypothetical protein Ct9H300mP25_02150 [Acidobacteriota bacterium]|nr:MAG: hypothetical protein Ct9H300mP25_02150 [Acidobacteriota bacterium]